jgi:hypothetical protein
MMCDKGSKIMRPSKDGATIGITLRLKTATYRAYSKIASKANLIEIKAGRPGTITPQDVMRERLDSIPELTTKGGVDEN